jgi:hypothetical protein
MQTVSVKKLEVDPSVPDEWCNSIIRFLFAASCVEYPEWSCVVARANVIHQFGHLAWEKFSISWLAVA